MCREVAIGAKVLDLNRLSWQRLPFALSNYGRKVWASVLFLSKIMHWKVLHAFRCFLPYLQDHGLLGFRNFVIMGTWRYLKVKGMIGDMSQFNLAKVWPCAINVRNVRDSTWSMMYMQVAGDTHSLAWIPHWIKNTGLRELWRPRIYAQIYNFYVKYFMLNKYFYVKYCC